MHCINDVISTATAKSKQTAENKQSSVIIKISNLSCLVSLYYINVAKYLQFLNFVNFGEEDTKQLEGWPWPQAKRMSQLFEREENEIT